MANGNKSVLSRTRYAHVLGLGALGALGLTAGAQRAMGQFTLSSEDRLISVSTDADQVGNSDEETGAGPFDNNVTDGDVNPLDNGDNRATSTTASQASDIETTGFSGMGSANTSASINGIFADGAKSDADSSYTVTFMVTGATTIQLDGELDATDNGTATVSFDGFNDSADGATPTVPFSFSEMLSPGSSYTLTLDGDTQSSASIDGDVFESETDDGIGSYKFSLDVVSVPEPGSLGLVLMGAVALLGRRRRGNCN
jgi:hypothetical protein